MNTKLLAQMALSGMLVISLAACQKSDDNKDSGADAIKPADAQKTVPANQARLDAEAILGEIGLQFKDISVVEESDVNKDAAIIHDDGTIKVAWDLKHYREFVLELRKEGKARPDLKMQVHHFIKYVSAMEEYVYTMEQGAQASGQEMSGEVLVEYNQSMARLTLAKDRLKKLIKRSEIQMKNGGSSEEGEEIPLEQPKEGQTQEPQVQPEAPKAA